MMQTIPLTQGLVAIVSPEDFARLSQYKWHAVKARATHYAARRVGSKCIYMHRDVLGLVEHGREIFVDHIDFDGLNNTRGNLRPCTPQENARNTRTTKTYLGLRGVSQQREGCWVAKIGIDNKYIYLGCFPTEREAGIAYDAAAKIAFGEFAPPSRSKR